MDARCPNRSILKKSALRITGFPRYEARKAWEHLGLGLGNPGNSSDERVPLTVQLAVMDDQALSLVDIDIFGALLRTCNVT